MTTLHAACSYHSIFDILSTRRYNFISINCFSFVYFSSSLCHWCCWMCTANSKWCEFQWKSPSAECIVLTAFRFYSIKRSQYSKHCIVILTPSCARHTNDVVFHFKNSTATTTKKLLYFVQSYAPPSFVCVQSHRHWRHHHIDVLPWHTHPRDGIEMDVRVLRRMHCVRVCIFIYFIVSGVWMVLFELMHRMRQTEE